MLLETGHSVCAAVKAELVGTDSLGLLGGHWTFVLSRVEQADICVLSHCAHTKQPSGTRSADGTQDVQCVTYLRSSSSSPSCWCCL